MNELALRVLAGFVLSVAAFAAGYWRGDVAATNRDAAAALKVERASAVALADANTQVRETEHFSGKLIADNSSNYQKELRDVSTVQKNLVSSIRTGDVRLSVGTRGGATNAACPTNPSASRRDGEARCELSDEAAEFLTDLASEADSLAHQLAACQRVIEIDRATTNTEHVQQK